MSPERAKLVDDMVEKLRRARQERVGPNATFEQRRDADYEIMRDALWKAEDDDLRELVTNGEEVDVDGKKFRRLEQASSATYFGRFGAHHIEEALYRAVGVHNGPTIKPIELRVGIVEQMTPDMARVVGRLTADHNSRALDRTLVAVGYVPPSRAFLQDHVTRIGVEVADAAAELEQASRDDEGPPRGVASVSCGLDRMAVRMNEIVDGAARTRAEPYERAPPPPSEQHYRMAWVGSTTAYDTKGDELGTWRCAVEADADPAQLADRVAADVVWLLDANPHARVHCVQDAAPELSALPEALSRALPVDVEVVELVDFEHVAIFVGGCSKTRRGPFVDVVARGRFAPETSSSLSIIAVSNKAAQSGVLKHTSLVPILRRLVLAAASATSSPAAASPADPPLASSTGDPPAGSMTTLFWSCKPSGSTNANGRPAA